MEPTKGSKWELNVTVEVGKKTFLLADSNAKDLEPRLKKDELIEYQANVEELETRRSGQQQNLSNQRSKTEGQKTIILKLKDAVVGVRNIVRSSNPTPELEEAFGIGEKIKLTVNGVVSAANIIMDGYKNNTAWSNNAGILDGDITEITQFIALLSTAEKTQDKSMYARKAQTMDKNVLQRVVEDEVTRLSALGAHEFRIKNPGLAEMFSNLIPSSGHEKAAKKKLSDDTKETPVDENSKS